jgi:hypothetical protein
MDGVSGRGYVSFASASPGPVNALELPIYSFNSQARACRSSQKDSVAYRGEPAQGLRVNVVSDERLDSLRTEFVRLLL